MLDRLGVRWRLLIAFFGISAFALLAAVAGVYSLFFFGEVLDQITRKRVPSALDSLEISRQAERVVAAAPALLSVDTRQRQEDVASRVAGEFAQLDHLLRGLEGDDLDPGAVAAIETSIQQLGANLSALNLVIASRLAAGERKAELLRALGNANAGAQALLSPGLLVMDARYSQLSRRLTDPALPVEERSKVFAQLAHTFSAFLPLQKAQVEVSSVNDTLLRAASAPDQADLGVMAFPLRKSLQNLDRLIASLDVKLQDRIGPHLRQLRELVDGDKSILEARGRELALIADGQRLIDENKRLSQQLTAAAEQLVAGAKRDIASSGQDATAARNVSTAVLILVVALSLGSSALIVWLYVGRNITARLTALSQSMLAIARGDLEARIPRGGRDEISSMAEALTVFRDTAVEVKRTNLREIAEARRRLTEAIESISEGFSLYDAEDRLVLCNSTYRNLLYPGIEDAVVPGASFESIIRRAVDIGLIADAEGNEGEWLQERLWRHRHPSGPCLQRRRDGRWIQISEFKIEDGGTVAVYADITELKRAEQIARESEVRFRNLFDSAPIAIWEEDWSELKKLVSELCAAGVADLREHFRQHPDLTARIPRSVAFTEINEAAAQLFGAASKEQLLEHLKGGVSRHDPLAGSINFSGYSEVIAGFAEGRHRVSIEVDESTIDGRPLKLIETYQRPSDDASSWSRIVACQQDITEIRRLSDELRKAKDEAEAANAAKSAFLATMSHEIRTPMNGIIGMSNLLMGTKLDEEQSQFAETISNSAEALLTIINDILDFSKVEAGRLDLEMQPFSLRECLEGAVDLVAGRAAEKSLDFAYLIEPGTPEWILGDSARLRQIILNLVNNAIKFTETGEVVLRLAPESGSAKQTFSEGSTCTLHFSVRDTGIGIPADRVDRLFKSFSQVDASTTRRYGGTGLGLAICKRLVELLGGRIWLESELGRGTTFNFTIPAAVAAPQKPVPVPSPMALSGKRVLIVDDNETNQRILSLQTASWSMEPTATGSPREALQWLQEGQVFDLAVLDMQMPALSGVDLAQEIRALPAGSDLPLLLLSSLVPMTAADKKALQHLRFATMLSKPIKPSPLLAAIEQALSRQHARLAKPERTLAASLDETLGKRFPLRILLADDNVTNQKLGLMILKRLGYRADVAANGLEVLDALGRQSYDVVLMDIEMPEMDGLTATQEILRRHPTSRPHIVALTANAMVGDRERYLKAGMDDYLSKPIRPAELATRLEAAWRMHDAQGRRPGAEGLVVSS
jgi:signal transduction histidine kinase/DNA-binding response OmpR family regulator